MLHSSLSSLYVAQRRTYTRLLRFCFAFAGIFWFLLYALPPDSHTTLRSTQSVIYFVLMTLWGLDYMREQRRLSVIIELANSKNIPPNAVTADHLGSRVSMFTMLRPTGNLRTSVLPVVFTIGILAAGCLILWQYVRAITLLIG